MAWLKLRGHRSWLAGWIVLVAFQIAASAISDRPIGSTVALFVLVVVAASGCVVTSAWLIVRAHIDDSAELGLMGAYAMAMSILPLVHGLTLPGVIYGANEATMTSVLWALPVASLAGAPLLLPRSKVRLLRHWRRWVGGNIMAQAILAGALLASPTLLPFAAMGTVPAIGLALVAIAPSIAFSARHLRLYRVSRRRSVLVVAFAFALIASSNLVWLNGAPMTFGFWSAHLLDIGGVFCVTIVAALAYRRGAIERDTMRPLTLRNPLDALEFGLDPVVRDFIADLGRKDAVTRGHVIRTAEAALVVGEELGLDADDLRNLGLGAILHDVGKLRIDTRLLTKPGRLTAEEYETIKQHAEHGEAMVQTSTVLAEIAPIVRHHHERVDGTGYPDGLAGEAIPLLARVVSVCDAYDAMAHTRHYRIGMDDQKVRAVLREHAGAQWDAEVVEIMLRVLHAGRVATEATLLADVGGEGCTCVADLPAAFERAPESVS